MREIPVFPTIASRFNDPGVNRLFAAVCAQLQRLAGECGLLERVRRRADRDHATASR